MRHGGRGNSPIAQQERIEIMVRSERKENDMEIATAMKLNRPVVRKWRRKARDKGRAGLITSMGRLKSGPLGHFLQELRTASKNGATVTPDGGRGCCEWSS
jgi:transposase-like protein